MAAAIAVALSAGLISGSDDASLAQPAEPVGQAGQHSSVTLITGDRVLVREVNGGTSLQVVAAPRLRPSSFHEFIRNGDRYLLPGDAAAMVQAGVLDRELFNVTGLVRQRYDDAHTASLPLLVRYADAGLAANAANTADAAAPHGATVRRTLPTLGMAALDQRKSAVSTFWTRLSSTPTTSAGGVAKVWLNAKVSASLDQSVPQIGAPTAWNAGLTGEGVTVAVLDTGIDTDHPDLAGKVAHSRDFTGKGSVEDGHGHGTHVASTIAGSGAASTGQIKGVAPDATLAVGKVLGDGGEGTIDQVIEGMRWAAVDAGAKIVNMSLGAGPTDGTDPVSEALNSLTREHGTLFVVAAGNFGDDRTVGTPAAAAEALAVGSVSKQDVPSAFSSRGPRVLDGAVKPEVAAPGEAIVAARPGGVPPIGEPVGEAYQRLQGTSMAAPHVAGAGAILAQQHPDWPADRLKAALTSTATEVDGASPYAVGTGRVDVARAVSQPVTATGSASAYLRWPTQGKQERRTVTWHNAGTADITLELQVSLPDAPAGLLTLSAESVTVPAGGSAQVELTATAQDGRQGTYPGVLTARTQDGTVTTRTALSVYQESEMYDLTVNLVNRDGAPPSSTGFPSLRFINLDTGEGEVGGAGTVRLPAGRYAVHGIIATPRAGQWPTYSFVNHPELVVDRDLTQTLDARIAHPVSVEPNGGRSRGGGYSITTYSRIRECGDGNSCTLGVQTLLDPRFHQFFAATVPGTSAETFAFGQARRAAEPELELFARGRHDFEVAVDWVNSASPLTRPTEHRNLPAVFGGQGTPDDLARIDARGKLVLIEVPGSTTTREEVYRRTADIKRAGARLAMVNILEDYTSAAAATLADEPPTAPALPTLRGFGPTAQRFAEQVKAGRAMAAYASRPVSTSRYELTYSVEREVTAPQVHRPRNQDLVAVRTTYHDNVTPSVRYVGGYTEFFGSVLGGGWTVPTKAPDERTEYFTPGTWNVISHGFWGPRDELTDTVSMVAGRTNRVVWNKAVVAPTLQGNVIDRKTGAVLPLARRSNGAFDVILPMYGDAAGRVRIPFSWDATDTGSISLYRDGALLQTVEVPDQAVIPVPAEAATYRLVAETHRDVDWWPLSTAVSAAWTFRSSAEDDGAALPLLTVRMDPDVDLRNRAPRGRFSFPVHVERQGADSVRVNALTVEVSYDDGHNWRRADVARDGDHWNVRVDHPATGYASLRATATDADGNSVRQTVIRAYQIGR